VRPLVPLLATTLAVLAGCGGGSDAESETERRGTTTTARTSPPHTTDVDGASCGELADVTRRLEVAGVLADEFVGTLTARTLLIPAFSAALSGACRGAAAGARPVPKLVEQADRAQRRAVARGGSFLDALLDVTVGEAGRKTQTVATGTTVEQANAACRKYRSLISRHLNDAVSEFKPFGEGDAGHLDHRVGQLRAELADVVSQGGPNAALIESFSSGLQELSDLGQEIADAESPGSETDAGPLKDDLRRRAGVLERSMPESSLFSCRSLVTVFS
jgi:hypothetical protein